MIITLSVVVTLVVVGTARMLYVAGYRRGVDAERDRAERLGGALRAMAASRRDEYGQTVAVLRGERAGWN